MNATPAVAAHPRKLGWIATTALAMGGSNQSLFILAALFAGQGDIPGQGSAAIPLLALGLLLSWAAAPGWTELILMYPNRVGGIAATCAEAFRPYSAVLANLTGVCYWWGWIPTCGLTAILSASAIHEWYLPGVPVQAMAVALVLLFTVVNLCGIEWASRLAVVVAGASALLALLSGLLPVIAGDVDWTRALSFHLTTPFPGWFGELTSLMAGLYLIGFAAPAFEAAACHVGETVEPARNVPRAMLASALLATLYFLILPPVWLGALGAEPLGHDLALVLGPTFAPLFGAAAKSAAIWFMMLSMFSGTLQPLAGAARGLAQLSEDGLLPRSLALRTRTDAPWVATLLTATMAIVFLLIGDPIWLIAAANFTYLISIALPSVAVWLLRRDEPQMARPYRAPRGTIHMGLAAAVVWAISSLLGFEQFGLPTVVIGVGFAYSGSILYAWRKYSDRRRAGLSGLGSSLQIKLTTTMLLVLALDSGGYLLAVNHLPQQEGPLMTALSDVFVAVAMLSITVALVLPGMVAHSAGELSTAAKRLAFGTVAEFARAMRALGRGDLDAAHAHMDGTRVRVRSSDEVGEVAHSFNQLRDELGAAVEGLDAAREGLRQARAELLETNLSLRDRVEELRLAEDKLSGVLNSLDSVVWSLAWDSGDLLYISPAVERVYGRYAEDLLHEPQSWHGAVHADDLPRFQHWLAGLASGGESLLQYRIVRPDAAIRWIEDKARVVRDRDGMPLRVDGIASDISDRKRHEFELAYLANNDPLTDLPNRNLLRDRVKQALAHARRSGERVALLFLDLDGFKFVNDSYGHALGDVLLTVVAGRLRRVVRAEDTVARLGGDEFVILLAGLSAAEDASLVAHKALSDLSVPLHVGDYLLHVTGSIGISLFPDDGDSYEVLLKHADVAMYRAKELGRNGVQLYRPDLGARSDERMKLESGLRTALAEEQFELHYQPQYDLATGRVSGMEALIRWSHPVLGSVSPARFIPVAEETNLILGIGDWVLVRVCEQLREWQRAGHRELCMAVNVSTKQIHDPDFTPRLAAILETAGIEPADLQLELTETALIRDSDSVLVTLLQLKELGVSLALDDFGTGYSSLSYLQRFPFDTLKIDRSFVASPSADAASLTRAIISMARSLNLKTVAEGVETRPQLEFLYDNGCDFVQGHYFSEAVNADKAIAYFATAAPAAAEIRQLRRDVLRGAR